MRFFLIPPIGGGRLIITPEIADGIRRCGFECRVFNIFDFFPKKGRVSVDEAKDFFEKNYNYILLREVRRIRPDITLDISPVSRDLTMEFKALGIKTCFWFLEDGFIPAYSYWRRVAQAYDFFFTFQRGLLDEIKQLGVKNYHYLPAAYSPSYYHSNISLSESDKNYYGSDVSFLGAPNKLRYEVLLQVSKGFDLKIWGPGWESERYKEIWPWVFLKGGEKIKPETARKIYSSSRINLNIHSNQTTGVNQRTFIIPGCGGFQVVDFRREISDLFNVGREIVCFSSLDDLIEKIGYFLERPTERHKVSVNGERKVVEYHTYKNRIEEMMDFIIKRLNE